MLVVVSWLIVRTQEPVLKVAEAEQRPGKDCIAVWQFVDVLVEFDKKYQTTRSNYSEARCHVISGTGMYGGNLELVSRRENVQVIAGSFCGDFQRNPRRTTINLCLMEIL